MEKKRSLAGNCGVGVFVVALVTTFVAFASPNWLVSDPRITSAKMDRIGLWAHCFRSLPDPLDTYMRRFYVGCRWVYDPFTAGYDQIRGYLLPPFLVATQFFYTLNFLGVLLAFILVLLYFLCFEPQHSKFIVIVVSIAGISLLSGLSGGLAVIIFASLGNAKNWMPDHENNYFGWSFGLAVVGVVACLVSSALFFCEWNIQKKKQRHLKESQTKFEMEHETKA